MSESSTNVELITSAIFQSINDAVVVYNADGVVIHANPASLQYYGFDPTGYQQKTIIRKLSVRNLDGRTIPVETLPSTRALHGTKVDNEQMFITSARGVERCVSVSTAPIYQENVFSGAVVIWHDITEREQLLRDLRRQRELLESIFQADPGGLAVLLGSPLTFVYANQAYRTLTPHPDIDPVGHTYEDIWPPSDGFSEPAILHSALEGDEPQSRQLDQRKFPDGSMRTFSIHARQIDWRGQPAVLDTLWETTSMEKARRQAEHSAAEARRLASQLDAVINAMVEAMIICDTQGRTIHANPAAADLFGFEPQGIGWEELVRRFKPAYLDGRELSPEESIIQRALNGETVTGAIFVLHFPDDREVTVLTSAAPMLVEDQVTGAVIAWRDVTEREQLVAAVAEERARLRAVIQNAPEPILVADASGKIILANQAAEELYGEQLTPGMSLDPQGIFHHLDGTPYKREDLPLSRAIRVGVAQVNVEMVLKGTDGTQHSLLVSAAPIFGQRRRPTGAVAVFQDISQRKRTEERLRREAERLELLAFLSQIFAEAGLYYPSVLGTISRRVAESVGEACVIRLVSDDGRWLDPVAFHHVHPKELATFREILRASRKPIENGLDGSVSLNSQPLVLLDMTMQDLQSINPALADTWLQDFPGQHAMLVPLRAQGRFIGTLAVLRNRNESSFTPEDQVFIQSLADRAAMAIENARLYAAESQRAHELEALHRAANVLLANLDLDTLMEQILETAREAIPTAEKGMLHLAEVKTGELKVRATMGYHSLNIQKARPGNGHDFLLNAVRNRRPVILRDLPGKKAGGSAPFRSAIVSPLILGDQVVGALSLISSHPDAFSDADLRLLTSLAATTTAAIQNAILHSEVQRLAVTDELTNQYNRRGFFELGEQEMERHNRFGQPLSAIMLDIDHFKEINDQHGHAVGDQVLATLARRCRAHIRQGDVLGRYGGEEFAILLPDTRQSTATEIAERIRRAVDTEPVTTTAGPIRLSISLGVTSNVDSPSTLEALLSQADEALYKAKQNGRNRVELK